MNAELHEASETFFWWPPEISLIPKTWCTIYYNTEEQNTVYENSRKRHTIA